MIRSADVLAEKIIRDPQLIDEIKSDPVKVLPKLAEEAKEKLPAYVSDPWVYRFVVLFLGIALLSVVVGIIILYYKGNTSAPDALTAIGSAAVGALAGLLAPSPARSA